ncbi:high affinity copper transporter [Massariosphaeria phaeospora]|uniref:Copper transport protein n=1 Tax=Massariosphaeria phaeospora TaxID=100035 RepID=A0A7C8I362_9PLEO|nr:high affinity copper transporter [Massariosphaeria phaeospora]
MSHHSSGSTAPNTANGECISEMLWNWTVVDACFLSSSWHIKSNAMFAASCIGIALLVVCLEVLRRAGKEHDAYLQRQFTRHLRRRQRSLLSSAADCCEPGARGALSSAYATFRASPLQQLCRALLHGATVGLAYIVMLLAMHYNGYVIISIVLGAVVGKFLCDWMVLRVPYSGVGEKSERDTGGDGAGPTGCCA